MIRGLIGSSLAFRFLVLVVVVAMMTFGVVQLRDMPADVLPEFSPPYVEIQTEALGLSAAEVEQLITVPMEQDLLSGVAWLDTIQSESVAGLSSVLVHFKPGTDLYRARQMVSERLAQAAVGLPHVSKPPTMIQPLSSTSRFTIVGLSSQNVSLIEMSVLARWVIAPRLMGVPGVANVAIWGQRDRQLQVQVDPERLRAAGISLRQVLETSGNALWVSSLSYVEASTPGTGGFIDTPTQRIGIWHVLPISSPKDLAQVPLEGAPELRLGDVARVIEDHQPLIGDAFTGAGTSLLLVVEKLPGTDTVEVTRGVEEALEALRPGLAGIDVDTNLFRPATFIETASRNLTRSVLAGAVLAVVALLLLLSGWRSALIGMLTIPVSLVAALFVLYARGATINTMVLAGLAAAIGVVIDDVVADVDNIMRHLRPTHGEGGEGARASAVAKASAEMRSGSLYATLILLLAVLPLFLVGGVAGAFFKTLALSYVLAIVASMLVAMIATPALGLILLGNAPLTPAGSPLLARLQRGYAKVLSRSIGTPYLPLLGVALLVVAGLVVLPVVRQQSWLPSYQDRDILVQWEGAPGTSRLEMERIMGRAGGELRTIPGVRGVATHVGRAVFGDQVVGINSAQLWVHVDPAADYDATVAAIRETIDGYPGLARELSGNLDHTLAQAFAGATEAITVRIFGENSEVLRGLAENVRQALSEIPGVVDLQVKLPGEEPAVEIEVDMAAAQRYGVKPGDVRRAAATLLSGLQVGSLFEEQKVFDVVVWSTPETRQSLTHIRELLIETPGGGHVRLEDVARVRVAPAPTVIRRSGVSPYLDVALNVSGRAAGAVERDVRTALRSIEYPIEYHAEVLAANVERQAARRQILLAALVALAGIFLLLQAASQSWRLGALAFLSLPAALSGGVAAMLVANGGLASLGSFLGLLAILGLAARNAVLLVRCYRHLEDEGEARGPGLALRGGMERFGPAVTTAIITGLIMAPFALFGNVPGQEILQPMAVVILGGLITTLLVSLGVLPALYLRFGGNREADLELVPATAAGDAITDSLLTQ